MKFSLFSRLHWVLGIFILIAGLLITGVSSRWLQEDKTNVLQELTVQMSASGSRQMLDKVRATLLRTKADSKADNREANFTLSKRATIAGSGTSSSAAKGAQIWDYSAVNEGTVKVDHLKEALANVDLKFDEVYLGTITGNKGETYVLMARLAQGRSMTDADAKLQVVIDSASQWEDLVRPFKGAFTTLFFVDDHGHIFLHPNQAYMGHVLSQNVAVQNVMSANRRLFTGPLKSDSGESSFVSYERVPKTNLVSVSTVPLKVAYSSSKIMMLFIMGAMTILAAIIFFAVRARIESDDARTQLDLNSNFTEKEEGLPAVDEAAVAAAAVSDATPVHNPVSVAPPAPLTPAIPTPPAFDFERMRRMARLEAIESLGRKLSKEFQGAIAATLGHVQLAKGKIESRDTLKHVEFIDREVRQIKETLDRMGRMGVYQTLELDTAKPLEVLTDIMDEAEVTAARWSVSLRKNFFPVTDFRIHAEEFKKAFTDLLLNRAQAMQGSSHRDLVVTVEPYENKIRIKLEDHGQPMSADQAAKFFDFGERLTPTQAPFDLKMPTVGAVFYNHGASAKVTPTADGNLLTIDFPIFFADKWADKKLDFSAGTPSDSVAALQREQTNLSFDATRELAKEMAREMAKDQAKDVRHDLGHLTFTESAERGANGLPIPPAAPEGSIAELTAKKAAARPAPKKMPPPIGPATADRAKATVNSDAFAEGFAADENAEEEQGPLTGFSVKVRRPRLTL